MVCSCPFYRCSGKHCGQGLIIQLERHRGACFQLSLRLQVSVVRIDYVHGRGHMHVLQGVFAVILRMFFFHTVVVGIDMLFHFLFGGSDVELQINCRVFVHINRCFFL
ncbi:hypothetical protein SDC9_75560 [bioreactor metagenome]|uniref:Uncharacterized protein n=1 Tax=bioreactor metagenome TaxID=1076179 RepID=A0A644YK55_9ZZZZ